MPVPTADPSAPPPAPDPAPASASAPPQAPDPARAPGWIRRLLPYLLRHRRNLAMAMGAAFVGSAAQATGPLIERQIVDNVILHHRSALAPWLSVLIALGVFTFAAAYFRRYRGGRVALDVQFDLRNAMFDHLQELDFGAHDRMPTGQLVARSSSDATLVQGLLGFFPNVSGNLLLLLSSLVIMFVLSPLLAVVSVVVVPCVFALAYRMRGQVFPATWDGQQKEGEVAQIVDEGVNGVRVVKAFGQERRELDRLVAASRVLYGSRLRATRMQARYQPLLQAVPTFGQVAVLALGGWLALEHRITLGTFLAFSTYLTQMVSPARMLAGMLTIAQQARAGVERIFELLDTPCGIVDRAGAVDAARIEGEVHFDHVSFAYEGSKPALVDFDLRIDPGETMALVGASGSGKTTAAMLLPRFREVTGGAVRIDGHDVRDLTLASLRGRIGVVFEESFLFSDTVRANIAYGRPDATDEEVHAAAEAARAHEFVLRLPQGYDTVVGERGLTLSGGQRQRIALARALLTDPRILILDDATSAVDAKVEEGIHSSLRRIMQGRTTLLVAHRRSTLHLADRIAVLEAGRVLDVGTHAELFERCPLYRLLLAGSAEDSDEAEDGGRLDHVPLTLAAGGGGTSGDGGPVAGGTAPAPGSATASQRSEAGWTPPPTAVPIARGGAQAGLGPGLGGGGGGGGRGGGHGAWRLNLAPTPELLAKVAALPPVRDEPGVDVEVEARHEPAFSMWRLLNRHRRSLGLGLVLVVLDTLASLAGPYLIRQGIDAGVAKDSVSALFVASAIFLAVALADLVDSVGETFVTGRTAERLMLALRIRVWAHLQRLSLDYYEREMAGRIMTRMTTDVDSLESLLENGLLSAVVSLCTFVGVGAALVLMNPRLAIVSLSVVVPLAVATVVFRKRSAITYDRARDRIAAVNAAFQETLSGIRESQAFGHEDASRAEFRRLGRRYLEARVGAQRLVALYFPFVLFLSDAADAVVLGFGAVLVGRGELSSGALIAFILYLDMFFSPIQQLSQVFDAWQQARVSMRRIGDLLALDTLTPAPEHPVDPGRLAGQLRLECVHFAYPARHPGAAPAEEALSGLDLEIAPGETVALVGETGAGKSTVMKLVARFYDPTAGRVIADGHDLRLLDPSAYRRQLGYVPQEAFLFTGSVRDNIAYGRPASTDAEVEAAARAVGAHDMVMGLPGGYLHVLSERGRSLSAGQRQLLALARAELVDPAILLLDEATSNLDLASEARVAAAMREVSRGRTTLIIAHRLHTAMTADRIVVMAAGRAVEQGSHEELLAAEGRYAAMWRTFDLVGSGARDPGVAS